MIYKEIKERFGKHLWLDVVSKCDLLHSSPVVFITDNEDNEHSEMLRYRKTGPEGAIRVSVKNEEGLNEVSIFIFLLTLYSRPMIILHTSTIK